MNAERCYQAGGRRTLARRFAEVLGWIVSSGTLALIPKCPMCLAAYMTVWTGFGVSLSAATHLRAAILIACAGLILLLTARHTRRLIHKFGHDEKIIRRRAVC